MRRDRVTWSAYATLGVFGLGLGLLGPAVPFLRSTYDLNFATAALHLTGFSVGATAGSALVAPLGRRLDRTRLVVAGLAALGLGGLLVAVAWSPVVSVVATVLMGVGGAVAQVVVQAVLGDTHPDAAGTAMNEGHIVASVGLLAAALAIAAAAAGGSWRLAFAAPAAVGVAIVAGARRAPFPTRPLTGAHHDGRLAWPVWVGAAATGLGVATEWAVSFWAASYLHEEAGLPLAVAGLATGGVFGAIVIGRLLAGRLAARVTTPTLLRAAALVIVAASIPYLLGPVLDGPAAPVLTVTALVVLGLGIAPLFPLTVTLTLDAARWQQRGLSDEASGAATGAGAIAGIAFPVLLGSIADRTSLQGALLSLPLLATGLFAAVTVVAVRIRRPMRSEDGDGRSRSRG